MYLLSLSHVWRPFGAALLLFMLAVLAGGSVRSAQRTAAAQPRLSLSRLRHDLVVLQGVYGQAPAALQLSQIEPADVVTGEATVTFAPDVTLASAQSMVESAGAAVLLSIPELNVVQVRLPAGSSVEDGIATLGALPGAVQAEPVTRLHSSLHPNDPLYDSHQRGYLELIHAEEAWEIQQGDPKVVTAVVDSGIEITHPDLASQIWNNPQPGNSGCGNDIHGCNFVDPRDVDASCLNRSSAAAPNPDVRPYYFHGTFVAGVLGAATNNGAGVAGIVPHAAIMPVKVGDCIGPISTALAKGILYAANNGASVINLSIGAPKCEPMPSYVLNAIGQAERSGAVVVVASGNDSIACVGSPANYGGVIAVGAVSTAGDTRASFSQWGPEITVVAPGQRIISTEPPRNKPAPNDIYGQGDGTSFAAPMVSGLADLLLSQDSLLTPMLVKSLIQRGATALPDAGEPGWAGAGRIDLAASLKLVPAGYYGRVTLNGATVPDGTAIDARIGGQVCGHAASFPSQGQEAYALFVAPATDQSGCGTPGVRVTLSVDGKPAGTTSWQPAALSVDLNGLSSTPQSSAAGGAVVYHSGWNLVAAPAGTLFDGATAPLYTLRPGAAGYQAVQNAGPAEAGSGYWAYFSRDTTVALAADGEETYSRVIPPGQYIMVGNPSGTVSVTVDGGDQVLVFDPVQNHYVDTRTLAPGQGALIFSSNGDTVTLH